ncbi:MAG: diacylglycerol/lipid kinase family protein [Phycisphaerales bacterium]
MGARIALLFNSIAGRGHAAKRARQIEQRLIQRGHEPIPIEFGPGAPREPIDNLDPEVRAMAVVGGDGSVRMAAPIAAQKDIPIWQCPCGTENLFAREFGMVGGADPIADALDHRRIRRIDLGVIDGNPFTLMASVGYDASVVHRLARIRKGAISHLSYIRPMLSELARLRPPVITVHADGKRIIDAAPGMLVIANSRQYAMRLNPASTAAVNDALLDLVFLPHHTRLGLLGWMIDTLMDRHLQRRRSIFQRAEHIEIIAHDQALNFQIDGDALTSRTIANPARSADPSASDPRTTENAADRATISVVHAAMPVLLPAPKPSTVTPAARSAETATAAG